MKIKMFLSALLIAFSATASAQFMQSGGTKSAASADIKPNYNRIFASYAPVSISLSPSLSKKDYTVPDSFQGFQVGWLGGFNIVKNIPLYIEVGANVQAAFHTEKETDYYDDYNISYTYVGVNIPVNIAYKYTFPNTNISVSPYAGLKLRGNIICQMETEDDTYSLFDEDFLGDYTAKRISLGYQIGVGFTFSKFYLGIGYTGDLTAFEKFEIETNNKQTEDVKLKTSGLVATVGVEF